ncbi:MAG TPA: type II toxin-antitoxin system death-on-curing family toxin [Egicoccus sp.]|nr:type II toxin-antitoxin system death-on-curing family toxin [Egicoccus sp.]HSK23783.1 type II toxin-antitoxin system death-on-curing family toxin [Egicoccus sp.]
MEYLDLEDLLLHVRRLGAGPVRDLGLLESAAARPRTTVFGDDAYPDVPHKAAALLHSVVRSHPLVDGNRRLGWLACVVFLDVNGQQTALTDDEAFDLVMQVAATDVEVAELAEALRCRRRGG